MSRFREKERERGTSVISVQVSVLLPQCRAGRNKVEKELACARGERRRAANCFASRGPEWLSPTKEEHDASVVPS